MIQGAQRMASTFPRRTLSWEPPSRWNARSLVAHALTILGLFGVAAAFTGTVHVGALLIIMGTAPRLRHPLRFAWGIPIFLGWALLSTGWSLLPMESLDSAVKLLLVGTAAVFLANSVTPSEFAFDLTFALILICLVSLAAAVTVPSVAFDVEMALRGITPHANRLGFTAALALFNCVLLLVGGLWRLIWIALAVIAGVTLLLSGSMTSLLGLIVGLSSCLVVWFVRRGGRANRGLRWCGIAGALGVIGLLAAANWDALTFLLGRDPTFTGRTQIWSQMVNLIAERPLTGYGVGAPLTPGSPVQTFVTQRLGFVASTAHNGPLGLALELGLVGLAILLPMTVMALIHYLNAPRLNRDVLWATGAWMFFATINIAEAYITTAFFWLILCYLWIIPLSLPMGSPTRQNRAAVAGDPEHGRLPKERS